MTTAFVTTPALAHPLLTWCSQSSGKAVIRSTNDVFQERTKALRIVVAILAERGFEVNVRRGHDSLPRDVDENGRIVSYIRYGWWNAFACWTLVDVCMLAAITLSLKSRFQRQSDRNCFIV
jgi:hypothetical protein